jgi:hypothetical protein
LFIEPGVSYQYGGHTFTFNVPFGYYYNRRANPYTGNAGDATFPREIFLSSYSWRFGGKKAAAPPAVTTTPAAAREPNPVPEKDEIQAPSDPIAPAMGGACSIDSGTVPRH